MALSSRLETAVRSSSGSPCTWLRFRFAGASSCSSCRLQMVPRARQIHALAHKAAEIHFHAVPRAIFVASLARFQHLLDRAQQAVGVVQH